jgi:hypothetical protein
MIAACILLCMMAIRSPRGVFLPTVGARSWGFRKGIQAAIYPNAIGEAGGDGGPRGLLRVGYPILADGGAHLVNFIAVEPTVAGRKGYSELERSGDGKPGKLFTLASVRRKGERTVTARVNVERFENGAHVWLKLTFRIDQPDELELRAYAEADSAPIQECVLTATMGNFERIRRVALADGVASSLSLYGDYAGDGFASDTLFPLWKLARAPDGSVVVRCDTDEADPRQSQASLPSDSGWRYPGRKVTQFWRAPRGTYSPDLVFRVNARRVYWMSALPLTGGIAFENFEFRDRFLSGQPFVFGITPAQSDHD